MKCEIVSFKKVYEMVKTASEQVKASGYTPTTIIGLARGGWIPARLMCDFLGITDLISLKVEHWLQTGKTKNKATIRYPLNADLKKKKLLVVDDITDTGKSLITSIEYLKKFNPEHIKVATMQRLSQSKYKPDYFTEDVEAWTWFIYPWNWIEDTSTLITRLMSSEKKKWILKEIRKKLTEFFGINWNNKMLRYILDIMINRGQIEVIRVGKTTNYKLKKNKVIEL